MFVTLLLSAWYLVRDPSDPTDQSWTAHTVQGVFCQTHWDNNNNNNNDNDNIDKNNDKNNPHLKFVKGTVVGDKEQQ